VRIIVDIGGELKLLLNPTMATAAVFFHRFYMFHSFKEFPKSLTALGCLFLAGKVEETPKKCKDLVNVARAKLEGSEFLKLGKNPVEEVMAIERVLLQTIKFDVHVEKPYNYLLQYANIFKVDKEAMKPIVQTAWAFINDGWYTTLCLQWQPEVIAISLMYMAFKMKPPPEAGGLPDWGGGAPDWVDRQPGEQWWDQFVANLTDKMMEEVCHRVLDYLTAVESGSATAGGSQGPVSNGILTPPIFSPLPSISSPRSTMRRPPFQ